MVLFLIRSRDMTATDPRYLQLLKVRTLIVKHPTSSRAVRFRVFPNRLLNNALFVPFKHKQIRADKKNSRWKQEISAFGIIWTFLEIECICIFHNDCTFSLYGKCLANLLILANSSFLAKLTLANQFFSNVFFSGRFYS